MKKKLQELNKTNHKINKMKKKVIKFNEQEIEKLVKKIIREEKLQKRKSLSEDRTDYEMSGTRTRGEYVSNPRERDVTSMFGKYGADVPPTVIRYMRKNPAAIMKRLYKIYGDKIYDYIPQQNVDIEENINGCGEGTIKEGDKISSGQLGKSTQQAGRDIKKMGLTPKEREVFNTSVDMLKNYFSQPGNQATGKALQLFNRFKGSLNDIKGEPVESEEVTDEFGDQ